MPLNEIPNENDRNRVRAGAIVVFDFDEPGERYYKRPIRGVADTFNSMAQRVQELLKAQKEATGLGAWWRVVQATMADERVY